MNNNPDITIGLTYQTANAVYNALEAQAKALESAIALLAGPAHQAARKALYAQIDALKDARYSLEDATSQAHKNNRPTSSSL